MRSSPPTAVHVARILEKYSEVKQVRLDPDRHTVNIGFYRLPSQSALVEIESAVRNELSAEWNITLQPTEISNELHQHQSDGGATPVSSAEMRFAKLVCLPPLGECMHRELAISCLEGLTSR